MGEGGSCSELALGLRYFILDLPTQANNNQYHHLGPGLARQHSSTRLHRQVGGMASMPNSDNPNCNKMGLCLPLYFIQVNCFTIHLLTIWSAVVDMEVREPCPLLKHCW